MLLCNTTFCVEDRVKDLFLNWVKETYIPSINVRTDFSDPIFSRIAHKEYDSITNYALQFKAVDHDAAANWYDEVATPLYRDLCDQAGKESILPFITFMEIIE